jgi:hypothetical protein
LKPKSVLIYGRLLDIILKLDSIDSKDTGEEFLNINELNIDARLNQKFSAL